jgi:Cof subfamily protein (haloacid dehalogenase superfamily)
MTISTDEQAAATPSVAMLISDIDGTLVTPDKTLTAEAALAVEKLHAAGVAFTLVSSRPPRGMAALVESLAVRAPFAAFNGASLVAPDLRLIRALRLSEDAARRTLALLDERGVQAWVFADDAWFLRDPDGVKVARERHTVGFDPTVVETFDAVLGRVDKIVGVSDDHALLAAVETQARQRLGDDAAAVRSQPYYLDITHPAADKGAAVHDLSALVEIDLSRTAVIGDMANDVAMFAVAGFSVAMGQAPDAVKAKAHAVTATNTDNGFAKAVETLILPRTR